tara:strand:+ start:8155 stop:8589 length:435 start_codon:yes stop_codon:yes gene_type:complete
MSLNKKLDNMFNKDFKKIEEEDIEELNVTGGGEVYNTPKAFKKKKKKKDMEESTFVKMSRIMNLSEINYKQYKNDDSLNSKQKVNKAIREVNSKLFKIERIINQNIKLKTEDGIDETKYWKSTRQNLSKISEKMERLSEKLRRF